MSRTARYSLAAAAIVIAGGTGVVWGETTLVRPSAAGISLPPPLTRTFTDPKADGHYINICAAWDGPNPVISTCGYAVAWMFCNDNGYRGVADFVPTLAREGSIAYMTGQILDVGRRFRSITCSVTD